MHESDVQGFGYVAVTRPNWQVRLKHLIEDNVEFAGSTRMEREELVDQSRRVGALKAVAGPSSYSEVFEDARPGVDAFVADRYSADAVGRRMEVRAEEPVGPDEQLLEEAHVEAVERICRVVRLHATERPQQSGPEWSGTRDP
jgi:hypothetical protein